LLRPHPESADHDAGTMRPVRCEEERMAKVSPFRLRVPEGACTNGVRPDLKMPGKTGWSDDDMMAGIARGRYYAIAWGGREGTNCGDAEVTEESRRGLWDGRRHG
jgi:hypothetical protein